MLKQIKRAFWLLLIETSLFLCLTLKLSKLTVNSQIVALGVMVKLELQVDPFVHRYSDTFGLKTVIVLLTFY